MRLEQPVQGDRVPAMHVDHARVLLQRIVRARLDAHDIAGIGAGLAKLREVITQAGRLLGVEKTACDDIAPLFKAALGAVVDHLASRTVVAASRPCARI
jgi:hypothetical protein